MTNRYIEIRDILAKNNTDVILYADIMTILTEKERANKSFIEDILEYLASEDITVIMENDDVDSIDEDEDFSTGVRVNEDSSFSSDGVKWYLNSIQFSQLTAEQEKEYACKAKQGDKKARDIMINHNLKLVVSIAKRYAKSTTLSFMDVVSAGNLGLMRAVDKYDPNLEFRFSTYATWWIRQSIIRYIADYDRVIRMPVHAVETFRFITKAKDYLSSKGNQTPSYQEIADVMNEKNWKLTSKIMTAESVQHYYVLYSRTDAISMETPIGEDDDSFLGDYIADDNINVEHHVEQLYLHNDCLEIMKQLKPREADVLIKRYGLDGNPPMTLEEIAQGYDLTRERIRQIEMKARRKFKHFFTRSGY